MECRICDVCNSHNELERMTCKVCGADIAHLPPVIINEQINNCENEAIHNKTTVLNHIPRLKLISKSDGQVVEIPIEGGIIGRDGNISKNYFMINPYVSSKHLTILQKSGRYYIIDENSTNGTYLNGNLLLKRIEYEIKNGDELIIANLEFWVK